MGYANVNLDIPEEEYNDDNIILRELTPEEYNSIEDIIEKEYSDNDKKGIPNYSIFQRNYSLKHYGMFINGVLVGLYNLEPCWGCIEILTYVLPQFRGQGFAGILKQKIIEIYGKYNRDKKYFISRIDPHNKSSLRVNEKLGWTDTDEYFETMINEGGEFTINFKVKNPYYNLEKEEEECIQTRKF